MPGSNAQSRPAKSWKALLAGAWLLVCGPASHGPAFDSDLAGHVGTTGEQSLDGQTEIAAAADDREIAAAANDRFVSREIALSGFVDGSLEASLASPGGSTDLSLTPRELLFSAVTSR